MILTPVLFDTGTEPYSYIEDRFLDGSSILLPKNSSVDIVTNSGFKYSYVTTAKENLTYVENPTFSSVDVTIFGLEFFLKNQFLMDYTNNRIGLKND